MFACPLHPEISRIVNLFDRNLRSRVAWRVRWSLQRHSLTIDSLS